MTAYNPFAPLGPKAIRRQARSYVNAQISPLLAQINRQFNQRNVSNQAAIAGYTSKLQAQLAPIAGEIQGYYNQSADRQREVNADLANRLNSTGGTEAAALNAKLAQAGIPQNTSVAATGSGAANAGAAMGSASLSSLLAQGAAQTAYAGKLPGIAALGGLQFARQNLAQNEQARNQQTSELQSRVPGLVSGELNQLQNLEFQKATAQLGFIGDQTKLADQRRRDATRARQPDASLSRTYGYVVDSNGNPILQNGKRVPVAKSPGAAGKTAEARQSAINTATSQAKSIFDAAVKPVSGPGGAAAPGNAFLPPGSAGSAKARQSNYYGTLKRVIGVVSPILSPYMSRAEITRYAQGIANSYYNPGQYGRPGRGGKRKDAAAAAAAAAAKAVGSIGF